MFYQNIPISALDVLWNSTPPLDELVFITNKINIGVFSRLWSRFRLTFNQSILCPVKKYNLARQQFQSISRLSLMGQTSSVFAMIFISNKIKILFVLEPPYFSFYFQHLNGLVQAILFCRINTNTFNWSLPCMKATDP